MSLNSMFRLSLSFSTHSLNAWEEIVDLEIVIVPQILNFNKMVM